MQNHIAWTSLASTLLLACNNPAPLADAAHAAGASAALDQPGRACQLGEHVEPSPEQSRGLYAGAARTSASASRARERIRRRRAPVRRFARWELWDARRAGRVRARCRFVTRARSRSRHSKPAAACGDRSLSRGYSAAVWAGSAAALRLCKLCSDTTPAERSDLGPQQHAGLDEPHPGRSR